MLHNENQTKELRAVGEAIDHQLAATMVKDFQESFPNERVGNYIGRDILDSILAQPGCVGIRFYNAINEIGKKTLVYVGVDAEGSIMNRKTVVNEQGEMVNQQGLVCDRTGGGPDTTSAPDTSTSDWDWDWSWIWPW